MSPVKTTEFRLLQLANALLQRTSSVVAKPFPIVSFRSPLHPLSIRPILNTLLVLKLLTSRLDKLLHPSKRFAIFVTLLVLNLLTSRLVKPLHPMNIDPIFVTLQVLNLLTSRLVKPLQERNIPFIFSTSLVFRYVMPSITVIELQPQNQRAVVLGFTFANEGSNIALVILKSADKKQESSISSL